MNNATYENIVYQINTMNKSKHIDILRIIKENQPTLLISDNSNGSFLNMNELTESTLNAIQKYIKLNNKREEELNVHETIKNSIIENYIQ